VEDPLKGKAIEKAAWMIGKKGSGEDRGEKVARGLEFMNRRERVPEGSGGRYTLAMARDRECFFDGARERVKWETLKDPGKKRYHWGACP